MKTFRIITALLLILQSAHLKAADSNDPSITETNPHFTEDKKAEEIERKKAEEKRIILMQESNDLAVFSASAEQLLVASLQLIEYSSTNGSAAEWIEGLKAIFTVSTILFISADSTDFASPELKGSFALLKEAVGLIRASALSFLNSSHFYSQNRVDEGKLLLQKGMKELKEAKTKIENSKKVLKIY